MLVTYVFQVACCHCLASLKQLNLEWKHTEAYCVYMYKVVQI
jgi:hypothetical protein